MEFALENISLLNILDVIIVGYLMYLIYKLLKGTIAFNIVIGVIAFYVVYWLVTVLDMKLLSLLLGKFVSFGVLILIIIFQPEIRNFLLMVGNTTLKGRLRFLDRFINHKNESLSNQSQAHMIISDAVTKMAKTKTGALIVLTQSDATHLVNSGTKMNAELNTSLLQNIFFKNAPLHDGAVILKGDKILAASTILPVSENMNLEADLGLRHRAAVGATENTNMVAIIVSEENGEISYAKNGKLMRNVSIEEIKTIIKEFNQN